MANEAHTIILPRTEDLVHWCAWLVPVVFSLLWDVWKACKRRALWVPGQALVLSALIIQLLSFIDYSHISVYSGSNYQTKEVVAVLVKNQLVIDSGRLMMCVLIAYLLPGMARSGSTMAGSDLTALALSIILNILSELQSVWKVDKPNESMSGPPGPDYNVEAKGSDRIWSNVSGITLFIGIIYLLLLLIHAAMIGRRIRGIMSQKIPSVLSRCCDPCHSRMCKETKDHVLKSWIVARVSQPDYVLARSALSSMAGLIVTVCLVISTIKWKYVQLTDYELLNRANKRPLTQFVIVGQYVIVLIGWIVVLIRWVNSVYMLGDISRGDYFESMSIEDAENDLIAQLMRPWVRDKGNQEKKIRDLKNKPRKLRVSVSRLRWYFVRHRFAWIEQKLRHMISWIEQKLSHMISSQTRFSSSSDKDNGQFAKYKEPLESIRIPKESARSLWMANKWGLSKVEKHMDQGHEDGKRSPHQLICLLRRETGTPKDEADREKAKHLQQANKNSWKRTAVSLIHFMIYYFHDGSDASVIEDATQCYIQAWEYMNFVDGLNEEVKSLGRQADKEFKSLQHSWNKDAQPEMLDREIKPPLSELIDQLKSCSDEERCNLQNSRDSTEVAKYCLFETWKVINTYLSASQIHRLQCLLARVYYSYMTEHLDIAVIQKCNKLAKEGMEEEILDVAFLSAKARGVMDKVGEGSDQVDNAELPDKSDQGSSSLTIGTENEEDGEGDRRGHYNAERTGNNDHMDHV